MNEQKQFQEVNGTFYDARTPRAVIDILERSRKTHERIRIFYGDVETGKIHEEDFPNRGRVGRTLGEPRIPILVPTVRSLGGYAIADNNIVQINESTGGRILYKREVA